MWVSRWLKLHHVFLVYLQLTFLSTLEQQGDYFREGQWSERSLIANAPLDCFRSPIWHTPLRYCTNASSVLCNANTPLCSSSARLHTRQTLWNDGLDMRGAKKNLFWRAMALTEEVAHNGSLQNLCDRLKFCQVELKRAQRVSKIHQSRRVASRPRCGEEENERFCPFLISPWDKPSGAPLLLRLTSGRFLRC